MNIDYPGIQKIKDKYKELEYYYNNLSFLIKKMLMNSQCNKKNKEYITQLCKMVGFDDHIAIQIINNKFQLKFQKSFS